MGNLISFEKVSHRVKIIIYSYDKSDDFNFSDFKAYLFDHKLTIFTKVVD